MPTRLKRRYRRGSPITISFRGRRATISRPSKVPGQIGRCLHYFHPPSPSFIGPTLATRHRFANLPRPDSPKKLSIQTSPVVCLPLASITDLAGYLHLAAESAPLRHSCRPRASNIPSVDPRHPSRGHIFVRCPSITVSHIALFNIWSSFHNTLFL